MCLMGERRRGREVLLRRLVEDVSESETIVSFPSWPLTKHRNRREDGSAKVNVLIRGTCAHEPGQLAATQLIEDRTDLDVPNPLAVYLWAARRER